MRGGLLTALALASGCAEPVWGQSADSIVYTIAPGSRFEVATAKSGVFSFVGHEHVIRARAFSGQVVYFPGAPERSRLELVVPTDSLEVTTPPDTAEIRKVTAAMRSDVLDVEHFKQIRFVSTGLTKTDDGFHVTGNLTLVSQTHEVSIDMKTEIAGDTLHAAGGFALKQTTFGIKPYHGGPGGLVRVADQVTFHLEAIGLRAESH